MLPAPGSSSCGHPSPDGAGRQPGLCCRPGAKEGRSSVRRRARDLSALFLAAGQFTRDSQLASVPVNSLEVLKAGVPINEIMHYTLLLL